MPTSSLLDDVRKAYALEPSLVHLMDYFKNPSPQAKKRLSAMYRSSTDRYIIRNGLLNYTAVAGDTPRVVVPTDGLKLRIMYESHDAPSCGHRGREKTYLTVRRNFYWPRQYEFVRKYIRACEVCQRVKPSPSSRAPLQPLPVPADCWESVSMDFIFGFPEDKHKNTGILVFVDRFSKMVHLVAVRESITAKDCARVFIDTIFRLHGLPREIVSDRDPRFTAEFWQSVFQTLGTRLTMSTSDHAETDGQTERANRVLEEILRGYVHSFTSWSEFLPMAEFAINNSVHASTTHTPFFVNGLRHPRIPSLIECDSRLSGGGTRESANEIALCSSRVDDIVDTEVTDVDSIDIDEDDDDAGIFSIANDYSSEDESTLADEEINVSTVRASRTDTNRDESVEEFLLTREAVVRFVQDSIANAVDRQKRNADKNGRANTLSFKINDLVLLSTVNLPRHAVTNVGSSKLLPRYIGPFRVLHRQGSAYTIELPRRMRTHPTFYVGRLRPYCQYGTSCDEGTRHVQESHRDSCGHASRRVELLPVHREENERRVRSPAAPEQTQRDQSRAEGEAPERGRSVYDERTARAKSHRVTRQLHDQTLNEQRNPIGNPDRVFPPPPQPLVDSQGKKRFLVERILHHRASKGVRTSYLVRWRGYPPAFDSWEPRSQLMMDVSGLVGQYDAEHPMTQAGHRRTYAPHGRKGIVRYQSLRTCRSTCASASTDG